MTIQKAVVLSNSALDRLNRLIGKTVVVKYGGNAMTDLDLQRKFAHDVVELHQLGIRPVVVHGGGPQIDRALEKVGKKGEFIQGLRVTDAETLQVASWVLLGQVQPEIVRLINAAGGKAVGLSGSDDHFIVARRAQIPDAENPTRMLDLGFVGEVEQVKPELINSLLSAGFIPVVSSIAPDENCQIHNINADTLAGSLAHALGAAELLLLTNTQGVLNQMGELIPELDAKRIDALFDDGTIKTGMRPKIAAALDAALQGVPSVRILDGRVAHVLVHALGEDQAVGTRIWGG